ncbi:MAG TPA: UDP-N-acetylmuramoyl-L-alanyl-D-glutamate--2,6-diaminopimelate ligase [Planctomycetota bacterium]|nr:UDP-N-acetylmuramoyl-L-alanyl-D-glutamate--2,6-diaminopimelate ligase [Planctomycetota bacterium]
MIGCLSELLAVLQPFGAQRVPQGEGRGREDDPRVRGISLHSERVCAGDIFVAIPGMKHDGAAFAGEAARRGASVAIVGRPIPHLTIPQVVVPDPRVAAAEAAAAWFGHPSKKLLCVGVTGTNGKTTTTYFLRAILEATGRRVGLLGTVAYDLLVRTLPAPNTTPDPISLQSHLRELVDAGAEACVMEVSSHALDQGRIRGVAYDAAVFTNLTPEHLDYHGDLDAYREAKAQLFDGLAPGVVAALAADDPSSARMEARTAATVLRYGFSPDAAVRAEGIEPALDGIRFRLLACGRAVAVSLAIPGLHNVRNALAAAAAAVGLGLPLRAIAEGLGALRGVPGRLERVDAGAPFRVCVDYAHTDASLEAVLSHLRPLVKGRLLVVFGCGGDRDRSKRPRMGAVAGLHADLVFVTSDNPRTEDPRQIVEEIRSGIGRSEGIFHEPDRRAAIFAAIAAARRGDLVLIAGKGHERVQIVGGETRPFDDREVAREALRAGA